MNTLSLLTLVGLTTALVTTNLGQDGHEKKDAQDKDKQEQQDKQDDSMQLGNFSISLSVKDIKASQAFYEKLDFKKVGGDIEQNWLVLQNGTTTIGLFQGLFEKNMLTFNPGWNAKKETLKEFQDVRELQHILKERGVELAPEADETTDGPAYFMLNDPDGNPILFDQHVPKPKR